ncbi:MAG: YbhB/YbcL family Raf kinase inhibitor-like protein [Actinomycetota bacterium]|nr:YbhB/YbcL family Raf kinase inhibitor-like protein [Actinomycetota bacterium]
MPLSVQSASWNQGDLIPEAYAFGALTEAGPAPAGGNRSPHLRWSDPPAGTRSYAVLVIDPDVPVDTSDVGVEGRTIADDRERRDFAHLVLVDLPPSVTEISEGALSEGITAGGTPPGPTPVGGRTGVNDYTDFFAGHPQLGGTYGGYDGPFPPPNDERVHEYFFTVFALDVPSLELEGDFDLAVARRAMEGHILETAEWRGLYTLNAGIRERLALEGSTR